MKRFFTVLVVLTLLTVFVGCDKDKVTSGTLTLDDGVVYEGEIVNGKAIGVGKLTYPSGDVYEGDVVDGKEHGDGKITWVNGDYLEGKFDTGEAVSGKLQYAVGTYYEGEFQNYAPSGAGKMVWPQYNGNYLEGKFFEGFAVNNEAKLTYLDQKGNIVSYYEGEYISNAPEGQGVMTWSSGTVGTGKFVASLISEGVMTYPNGDSFEGKFQGNAPKLGTMKYMDNPRIFEGEFSNSLPNGEGVMTYYTDATFTDITNVIEGYFLNGQLDMTGGPKDYVNGVGVEGKYEIMGVYGFIGYRYKKSYQGELTAKTVDEVTTYSADGLGKMAFSDSSFIIGEFVENSPVKGGLLKYHENGAIDLMYGEFFSNKVGGENAVFSYANKDVYIGEAFEGKPHGIGALFMYEDNKLYIGEFVNGAMTGKGIMTTYTGEEKFTGTSTEQKGTFTNGIYNEGSESQYNLVIEAVYKMINYGEDYYIGMVDENDAPHGVGFQYWSNGNFAVGTFEHGDWTFGILSYTDAKAAYYGEIVSWAPKSEKGLFAYNPEGDTPVAIGQIDGVPKSGVFIYTANPRIILAETWGGDHPATGTMVYFNLGEYVISNVVDDWSW